jgi:hypothetical protein
MLARRALILIIQFNFADNERIANKGNALIDNKTPRADIITLLI